MSDTPARAIVVKEAPGWPTWLDVYPENGERVRVEVTGQELRLAIQLTEAAIRGARK